MELILPFFAGFLGSVHCVGMCGAVVLAYSSQNATMVRGLPAVLPHIVYNSGRIFSYGVIGGLAGLIGRTVGSIQVIGPWIAVVVGILMVLAGLIMLNILPRWNLKEGDNAMQKYRLAAFTRLLSLRSVESKLYIGLLTPLLPCGLLYAMVMNAGASSSVLEGALGMLAFGAGSVPALFVTGLVSAYVGVKLRFYANRIAAIIVILMGVMILLRGAGVPLPLNGPMHHEHGSPPPSHQHPIP